MREWKNGCMGKWVGEWTMRGEGWNGWGGQVDVRRHDCGWGCREVGSLDVRLGAWVRACEGEVVRGRLWARRKGGAEGQVGGCALAWLAGRLAGWLAGGVGADAGGRVRG